MGQTLSQFYPFFWKNLIHPNSYFIPGPFDLYCFVSKTGPSQCLKIRKHVVMWWVWGGRDVPPFAPILTCLYFDISKGVIIPKNSVRGLLIDLAIFVADSCNFFQICMFFCFFRDHHILQKDVLLGVQTLLLTSVR